PPFAVSCIFKTFWSGDDFQILKKSLKKLNQISPICDTPWQKKKNTEHSSASLLIGNEHEYHH
ncbi:hypothetical protein ACJX0J_025663, partial [Zea mays]